MKVFYNNRSNILNDVIHRIKYESNIIKAQALLTWNCVATTEAKNVALAKEYGIPSFVYDHGLMGYNDHSINVQDGVTKKHGNPMTADYYLAWGQAGVDALKGSVPEEKIKVVGCPVIWKNIYTYANHENKELINLGAYQGNIINDPATKKKWEFISQKTQRVKSDGKGRIVLFMPNHSEHFKERTVCTFNQIKDIPNLFVKCTSSMANWQDGPFGVFDGPDRNNKIIFVDPQMPSNLVFIQEILRKTKVIISEVPGTAQLLGWAAGIPVIVPKYDWLMRDNAGNVLYNTTKADIECDPNEVKQTVEKVLSGEIDKTKEMEEMAEYHGGISLGNPTDNILKVLKEMGKK